MAALLAGIAVIGLVLFGASQLLSDEKSQASSAAAPVEASVETSSPERRQPVAQRPSVRWVPAGNAVAPAEGSISVDPAFVFKNCDEVRAANRAPIRLGEPGYGPHLDGNPKNDIGCESR